MNDPVRNRLCELMAEHGRSVCSDATALRLLLGQACGNSHDEIDALSHLVKNEYGETVELFVHSDGCLDFSCKICTKTDCDVRKHAFEKKVEWTMENISNNHKHSLAVAEKT